MAKRILLTDDIINKIISYYNNDGYSAQTIANISGYSAGFIQRTLRDNNVKSRNLTDACNRVKNINNIFEEINDEKSAYYLGLFYADGNVAKDSNCCAIRLIESDRHILTKLSDFIYRKDRTLFVNYKSYSYGKNANNLYTLMISSDKIKKSLIQYGCIPCKSLILKFPTFVPDHLLHHFVRGYFDGDGSIYKDNSAKSMSFNFSIVSTDNFCQSLKLIIDNMHIHSRIFDISCKNGISKQLNIAGNRQVETFMDWMYKDSTLYIERKYNKYLELKERITDVDIRYPGQY